MADLIDRDALMKDLRSECPESDVCISSADCIECIVNRQPAVNRWIPCNEKLPEQEVRILLFAAGEVYVGELTDIKDLFDTDIGFMQSGHVTHWMPLPEPPEKE